jgi:hypothetical protein
MKYFSTRGGDEELSFEEVNPIDPRLKYSPNKHKMIFRSTDSPHRPGPKWWPLHPNTHPNIAQKLAE